MKSTFIKLAAIAMMVIGATSFVFGQIAPVSEFNTVFLAGSFNVFVKIDGTESLKITAPDDPNMVNEIGAEVQDRRLRIFFKDKNTHYSSDKNHRINIYISAKELSTLINSGSGNINVESTVSTSKFKAILSGSGSVNCNVKADLVNAVISGSGHIKLSGNTDQAKIMITGSGKIDSKDLKTETSNITITGSGDVAIAANKELSSKIIGSGSVKYTGNAQVKTIKIGAGSVTKVG